MASIIIKEVYYISISLYSEKFHHPIIWFIQGQYNVARNGNQIVRTNDREQESDWWPVDGKFGEGTQSKLLRETKGVKPFYYINFSDHYTKITKVVIYWGKLPSAQVKIKYRTLNNIDNEEDTDFQCATYK